MYRSNKKKRTTKELFVLLREKVLAYCKDRPKMPPPDLNNANIIFPGEWGFKKLMDTIDYGESSISKSDLKGFASYLEYDFPLQTFNMKFDNTVLNPLKIKPLFDFGHKLPGKPYCLGANHLFLAAGWSNGIVMLFDMGDLKKVLWTRLPGSISIEHICVLPDTIVCSDNNQMIYLLQVDDDKLKVQSQFQHPTGSIRMIQARKNKDSTLVFISDSEGCLSKLQFKKILLMQTRNFKLIVKHTSMIFHIVPQQLSKKYFPLVPGLVICANSIQACIILQYNPDNDTHKTLYTMPNFAGFRNKYFDQKYCSVESMEYGSQRLVVCCSFGNRVFFISCGTNPESREYEFTPSRRMNTRDNVVGVYYVQSNKFLIMTQHKIYYCLMQNVICFETFTNLCDLKTISCRHGSHTDETLCKKVAFLNNNLVWVDQNSCVKCCTVMNWKQVYRQIYQTEGLFLLYYLILTKYVKSPYLERPLTLQGLETSFPHSDMEEKQLLLQYYYLTRQPPPSTLASPEELSQLLIPFIFSRQLSNLSDQQLDFLIKFWEEHQLLVVQQIILSGIDKGWEIAIKNVWMRSVMKIAQMGEDYQYPLLKMCGYFITNEENQELSQKYSVQIIKYMSLGINKDLQQVEDDNEYSDMIKIFVKILLDKGMYIRLAKYKPKKVVSLFTDLFRGDSLRSIIKMKMDTFVLSCTSKYQQLLVQSNGIDQIIYSHCTNMLLKTYPQMCEERMVVQQAILIQERCFCFTKERTIEIITRLIGNPLLSERAAKIHNKPNILEREQLYYKQQSLVLDLLHFIKSTYQTTSEEINNLLQECEKSRNLELVSIQLMKGQRRFESILSKYIGSSNSTIRGKVFAWLVETTKMLNSQQNEELLQEFNRIVLSRMKELIVINKERTREFIQTYFKNSEKKLIHRIENDPQLQLEYVELVLQEEAAPDQELLELHIKLLCRLEPLKIIDVLEAAGAKYNLDSVLKECQTHADLDNVIIYLHERMGQIYQAVAKHLQLFFQEWQLLKKQKSEYTFKRNQALQKRASLLTDVSILKRINVSIQAKVTNGLQDITNHFEHILQLIHRQFSQVQLYQLMVNLISRIYTMEENEIVSTRSEDHTLIDKITQFLGMIILDLAREGHVDFLIDKVFGRYQTLSLREMKQHIKDVYSSMLTSRTVIGNILYINCEYLLALNYETRRMISKSIGSVGVCSLCEISILPDDTVLLFSCGDLYHLECAQSQDQVDYCSECICNDAILGMIDHPQLNLQKLVLHRQARMKRRGISQIRAQVQNKKKHDIAVNRKLNKMRVFDKKLSELAIQTEIIELRLQTQRRRQ